MKILLCVLLTILTVSVLAVAVLAVRVAVDCRKLEKIWFREERPTEADGEREEKPGKMDEGFENIMTYAVGGKTGFETEDE